MLSSLSSTMSTVFFIVVAPGSAARNTQASSGLGGMSLHGPALLSDDDVKVEPVDEIRNPALMTPHKKVTVKEAETVALGALSYLAADDGRLARFLDSTGLRAD